ncbi:MAG: prepilin-type N-terminal cleavage/methylation domain-containing protein [Verrucomicrobia bacterium]|nr:prepilin-type N-terminal cleavage/methylation domain-containing protein [Verrucomicrobiota bacterium]
MRARRTNTGAFTLVEVLLAIAILALIMTAIYASWTSILRGSKAGLDAAAQVQRERVARQTVETALSASLLFQENVRYYAFLADTTDERFAMLSFVAKLPDSFPGSGLFLNEPVRRVTFGVEPSGNGGGVLTLRQHSILATTNVADDAFRITLASNVLAFGLEFWETNLNDFSSEWIASNSLPKLVRVTIGFGDASSGAAGHLVSSVVSLAAHAVPREVQIPNVPQGGGTPPGGAPVRIGVTINTTVPGQPGGGKP